MSKRTKAEWKAKQQWRADLDARHADYERRQEIKRITADLPINSRISIDIADDPNSARGEKITVVRSLRTDPLAVMRSRGVIDAAEFNAGRMWQKFHELSQIGPIAAIDPGKEAVDGGRMRDPLTDKQIDAFRELGRADMVLGEWGKVIIRKLLAEGRSMGEMCADFGCDTGRKANFLSIRIRECLKELGMLWNLIGRDRRFG